MAASCEVPSWPRYAYETDLLNHAAESQVQTQTLTASLRPLSVLTITPTLGYRAERPEWSSARIDFSLSLTHHELPAEPPTEHDGHRQLFRAAIDR